MPESTKHARVVPLSGARGLRGRIWREIRHHRIAYAVLLAFVLAAPFIVHVIFPEASPWVGVVGGIALAIWGALCAMPDKFLE